MSQPDVHGAIEYAAGRMARELAPELTYHCLSHTFEDVLPAAMRLADSYGLIDEDRQLLAAAAALHDIGWVIRGHEHERVSAQIAREVLPDLGFSDSQIERIAGIIMATRIPQSPNNLLEQLMADADLDVLGREDFWLRNEEMRSELAQRGHEVSDEEWYRTQIGFLESHTYFTEEARRLRGPRKQMHIREMKKRLAEVGPSGPRRSQLASETDSQPSAEPKVEAQ